MLLWQARSALNTRGWFRSRNEAMCVDAAGRPVPWYTYPAIAFLEQRVPADAAVFEFGMGNSTLWWSKRAAHVACVEGDQGWFAKIAPQIPANVAAILHPADSEPYVRAAADRGEPIDILVIDGRQRVASCMASTHLLTERGVVVWDNAERERYAEGYAFLAERGFRRLDFWGMGPLNVDEWLTTIFYRTGNLLGI